MNYNFVRGFWNKIITLAKKIKDKLTPLTKYFKIFKKNQPLFFIHIGKCSGSTITKTFQDMESCHVIKPFTTKNQKIIIWIRNPFSRIMSAFKYQQQVVNFNALEKNFEQIKRESIAPKIHFDQKRLGNKYVFSKKYDTMMKYFKCHNHFFESINDSMSDEGKIARKLLKIPIEHINRGMSWYLSNGKFLKKYQKRILFVGRTEKIEEDIKSLSKILNRDAPSEVFKIRSTESKNIYLSKKSIQNLTQYFKKNEFKTLKVFHELNFIDFETYINYQKPQKQSGE